MSVELARFLARGQEAIRQGAAGVGEIIPAVMVAPEGPGFAQVDIPGVGVVVVPSHFNSGRLATGEPVLLGSTARGYALLSGPSSDSAGPIRGAGAETVTSLETPKIFEATPREILRGSTVAVVFVGRDLRNGDSPAIGRYDEAGQFSISVEVTAANVAWVNATRLDADITATVDADLGDYAVGVTR